MNLPEAAPDWRTMFHNKALFELLHTLEPVFTKANREYLYWDTFKHQPLPEGISPETAWSALKFTRAMQQVKTMPLQDEKGELFTYWVPDSARRILHFLDQNTAGQMPADEPGLHDEERERYRVKSLMEEAIASSRLEGAATARAVAKDMLRSGRKPQDHSERMICNTCQTITQIQDHINEPLSPELLLRLHSLIVKDTLEDPAREGRFRIAADGDIRVHDEACRLLHAPPPPGMINDSIESLCAFINEDGEDDGQEFVHPVIRGIILHFWLVRLSPFADGNGRIARVLFSWFMLRKKYRLFERLSVSRIMRRAAMQYSRAFLYPEMDDRDMTYFIMFHLRAVKLAVDELKASLARRRKESRKAVTFLRKQPELNHRQRSLLQSALDHPDTIYTFHTHMHLHGVVYQTARTDLLQLHESGLLEMYKSGHKFQFTAIPDLKDKLI